MRRRPGGGPARTAAFAPARSSSCPSESTSAHASTFGWTLGRVWAKGREGQVLQREGKTEAAAAIFATTGFEQGAKLLRRSGTQAERDRIAPTWKPLSLPNTTPRTCTTADPSSPRAATPRRRLRLLRQAVDGNYLAYPAMDLDPLYEPVRKSTEFAAIRAEAIRKQKEFLAKRGAPRP